MANGKINKSTYVICNGFKRDQYIENISRLINNGHKNTIPIIDNFEELDLLQAEIKGKFKIEFVCI
jgi:arginine decarboxylase